MRLYFVRNRDNGLYLHWLDGRLAYWGSNEEADVYHTRGGAYEAGESAFDFDDAARELYEIIEIDTEAGLNALRDLYEVHNLGDFIHEIRESEGLGWEGPQVTKWRDTCRKAKKLLQNRSQSAM